MKETYKIEKLEDMPIFVPIIYVRDTHFKDSTPRMVGNDIHDEIVIETGGNYLYYYNLQCGESSHECSDFRFVKRDASCYDDEFYSHFCQMVDLEKLVEEHDKQVRKEMCEEIKDKLKLKEKFHSEDDFEIDYDFYYKEDVEEVLDQIQGDRE